MYINNVTFIIGAVIHQAGEANENPTTEEVEAGLVREAKVEKPTETKEEAQKGKKEKVAK